MDKKKNNSYEERIIPNTMAKVEFRKEGDEGEVYIDGLGIPFNQVSQNLGGFVERIMPEAVSGLDWNDVYSFVNHNHDIVMGRTKSGTMSIEVKNDGVHYSVKPPRRGAEMYLENIERGDIDGSSFMFRVAEDGETWEDRKGELPLRTITKFKEVKEMGAVVGPAYLQSTSDTAVRSLEKWREDQKPKMDDETRKKGDILKIREKDNVGNFKS